MTLKGITTDGSSLYPEPIATVFGDVPHQLCTFHVLHEVTKAVLSAVAKLRKDLAAGAPKLPRGRPGTKAAKQAARRKKRIEREGRRTVRAPLPVRPAPSHGLRAEDTGADHPRPAAAPHPAWSDGGGLSPVRPAVPDGDGVGQAGATAGAVAAICPAAGGAEEAVLCRVWRRRWCSWTRSCWERRRTRWSEGTVGTGRCRRRCTGCGRSGRSRVGWRWTCLRERQARGRAETTKTLHKARAA